MLNNNQLNQSVDTNRTSRWVTALIIMFWLIAGALVTYWILSISTSSQLTPPPIHIYEGEELVKYELRRDSYVQLDESKSDSGYSIEVQFDNNVLSPAINSSISASIKLLKNGRPVTSMPERLMARDLPDEIASPKLYVKTYGVYGLNCDSENSWDNCINAAKYLPVKPVRGLELSSYIYSPQVRYHIDALGHAVSTYFDFSQGEVELELVYRGSRYAPYLEFEFFNSLSQEIYTRKIIPFEDQVSSNIDLPNVNQQIGSVAYDVAFSPTTLQIKESELVKIDIIAKDVDSGKINSNPYQRVKVWAYPLAVFNEYSNSEYIAKTSLERAGKFEGAIDTIGGRFTSASASSQKIADSNLEHRALLYGDENHIEIDLIDGKGTVYFAYNGKKRLAQDLVFVVQPTNYDYEATITDVGPRDRRLPTRYSDELPLRPDISDEFGFETEYEFLYIDWLKEDSFKDQNYTVVTLPILGGEMTGGFVGLSLPWLKLWMFALASQLIQLIFGGLIIWIMRRKHNQPIQKLESTPKPIIYKQHRLVRSLQMSLLLIFATGFLIYGSYGNFNRPGVVSNLMEPPTEQLSDEFIRPVETHQESFGLLGGKVNYKLEIILDDKVNPYSEGVTKGLVRVVDEDGNIVPVEGAVEIRETSQNSSISYGDELRIRNKSEIRGQENINTTTLLGRQELRQIIDPTFGSLDNLADGLGMSSQFREAFGDDLYVYAPIQITPDSYIIWPGCNDITHGWMQTSACHPFNNILILHDGVAEFEYVNHQRGHKFVTLEALGRIVRADELKFYDKTNYQSYSPNIDGNIQPYELEYKIRPGIMWNDYINQNAIYSVKSFTFADYQDSIIPTALNEVNTKVGYYYEIESNPKQLILAQGNRFNITIAPQVLSGHSIPQNISNQVKIKILPGYDFWNRLGYYGDVDEKTYPAGFVELASGELSSETDYFEIGTEPVTLELEYTGEPTLLPYLSFEMEVFGVDGYPEYLDFVTYNMTNQGIYAFNRNKILRDDSPDIMQITFSIPVATTQPSYLFLLIVSSQLAQIVIGVLMIFVWNRKKKKYETKT